MTLIHLALKHAPPKGFWKRAFHALTKARLLTRYPHAGIVIDGQIMHSNLAQGLHGEEFISTGWSLFPVTPDKEARALGLFDLWQGTPYDVFSLLTFVLPWTVRDGSRLYCYEWCWLALTGEHPQTRVTPEDLLALIAS